MTVILLSLAGLVFLGAGILLYVLSESELSGRWADRLAYLSIVGVVLGALSASALLAT